jgi:KS-AT-KR-ACP domain-containing polyene macrolide polyketide synthase/pimaricinolide synthase PimS2/candicidin polyketide synthase FscD
VLPWVLSGRGAAALRAQAERLVSRVTSMRDPRAADLAHSLATTRFAAEHRAVAIGAGCAEPLAALRELAGSADGVVPAGLVEGTANVAGRTVFVFPGQGAQWAGMALELLDTAPVFAGKMAECAAALSEFADWSLFDALRDETMLARVDVVQPVSFAVMVSLAALWQATGIEPDAVVGHSQGEIAAACVSGALSLRDAAAVVALRSKAIRDELAGHGGMVSVSLSAAGTASRCSTVPRPRSSPASPPRWTSCWPAARPRRSGRAGFRWTTPRTAATSKPSGSGCTTSWRSSSRPRRACRSCRR